MESLKTRMSWNIRGWILLATLEMSLSAMVLPRPPSSPNHIQDADKIVDRKLYNEKALRGQSTNVEKPNTDNYRLLEIELHGADVDAFNLNNILQAMIRNDVNVTLDPSKETPARIRPGPFKSSEDKRTLLASTRIQDLDEKLYYLKSGRPKVYVNLRGKKERVDKDFTSNAQYYPGETLTSEKFEKQMMDKGYPIKDHRPKKFYSTTDSFTTDRENFLQTARNYQASRPDSNTKSYGSSLSDLDDPSTTENSMVTSSELPKQIPAPPSRNPGQAAMAQTTPVQKYMSHRTDILPGYGFADV